MVTSIEEDGFSFPMPAPSRRFLATFPLLKAKSNMSTGQLDLFIGFPLHEHLDKNRRKS